MIKQPSKKADLPVESWDSFFDSMKTVHSFKLPLQLCLSVSPVCLFLPASIMHKDFSRVALIQVCTSLKVVAVAS